MWSCTRREFLGVVAAAVPISRATQLATPSLLAAYVYAAESIAPGLKTSPFVLGFLVTRQPHVHIRRLAVLKLRSEYRRELTYHNNDELKVRCMSEFIRYFADEPDLRFAARIVRPSDGIPDSERTKQYSMLIRAARVPTSAVFRLKHRQTHWGFGRKRMSGATEQQARVRALRQAGVIRPVETISKYAKDGVRDGLVELANLLTGTLYGAIIPPSTRQGRPRRSPIKATGGERLREALRVKDLATSVPGKWEISLDATTSRGALAESQTGIERRLYDKTASVLATDYSG